MKINFKLASIAISAAAFVSSIAFAQVIDLDSAAEAPPAVVEPIEEIVVLTDEDRRQIQCMAVNSYFEARAEPREGIIAVHNVVMNRVADDRFPDTPCGVIYQRNRRGCQFSWFCDGRSDYPSNRELYSQLEQLAEEVYIGNYEDITHGAQFYHATYVRPRWRHAMSETRRIGLHVFYEG